MKTPNAKQRIKAQKGTVYNYNAWDYAAGRCKEFYVLPADAESYERMVEQVAHAIDPKAKELCEHFERRMLMGSSEPWYDYRKEADGKARAALRAIGITAPKRGKKGSK